MNFTFSLRLFSVHIIFFLKRSRLIKFKFIFKNDLSNYIIDNNNRVFHNNIVKYIIKT